MQTFKEIKTQLVCLKTVSEKSCRLGDNVEKCGIAGQSTGDNMIRSMRFACWTPKATDTHSEYVKLLACQM